MEEKETILAWTCPECSTPKFPEELIERAMTTPSGADVAVAVHCPCGTSALLSWPVTTWNAMHYARRAQMMQEQTIAEHRRSSEIGREVAAFRQVLETVNTVEEMGLV